MKIGGGFVLSPFAAQQRIYPFVNKSGEVVPPFAAVKFKKARAGAPHKAYKPDRDDDPFVVFNGPFEVEPETEGYCTADYPLWAKYASGDGDPGNGESIGTRAGYWELHRGYEGFLVWGGADGEKVYVQSDVTCRALKAGGYYGYYPGVYQVPEEPYSTDCCYEEGIAADWDFQIQVATCSSVHFYHNTLATWTYVMPQFGGIEAAYIVRIGMIGLPNYFYDWEETYCEDTTSSTSVSLSVATYAECGGGTNLDIQQVGTPTVGPKLKVMRWYYQSPSGGDPDPSVDTLLSGPITSEGEYTLTTELFCECPDGPFDNASLVVQLSPPTISFVGDPNVSGFGGMLAYVTYHFANGIRCFSCYQSTSRTDDSGGDPKYDADFLPAMVTICPA